MDAVEFLKTFDRLCRAEEDCSSCPLNGYACDANLKDVARYYTLESVQDMVQKVEQWAKEHPVKTRQSEFLKRFPNADLTRLQPCMIEKDKRPMWCGKYADFGANCCCDECRYAYWNEEVYN